jgi:hypothetical protein
MCNSETISTLLCGQNQSTMIKSKDKMDKEVPRPPKHLVLLKVWLAIFLSTLEDSQVLLMFTISAESYLNSTASNQKILTLITWLL